MDRPGQVTDTTGTSFGRLPLRMLSFYELTNSTAKREATRHKRIDETARLAAENRRANQWQE